MTKEESLIHGRLLGRLEDQSLKVFNKEPKKSIRQEGEIWEENNKKWIFQNGTIKSISKFDKVKTNVLIPNFCPSCKCKMKDKMDEKMYKLYNHCFSCQLKFETQLKINGLYQEWETYQINKSIDSMKKALNDEYQQYLSKTKVQNIYNEDGIVIETISDILEEDDVTKLVKEKMDLLDKIKK